jgi:Tfp pilus assembly protein PilX
MKAAAEHAVKSLRGQDGVALPVALMVLMIVTLLVAAATTLSVSTNSLTNRDANSKSALGAADAGQRVAVYRLNMLAPADGNCVTTVVAAPVAGKCPQDGPEGLGNGATFTYSMTPVLGAGASCAGLSVVNQAGLSQRCITAIGAVNGVSRRTQTRVVAFAAQPLFPVAGFIGLKKVNMTNNATIAGAVASNGPITIDGSKVTETDLGPVATYSTPNGGNAGTVVRRTASQGAYVLSPADPGNSATVNDNGRIANGLLTPPTPLYDASSNATFASATRSLTVSGGALTLGGATYNFCNLTLSASTLALGIGAKTRIFIDSPDRPGSGCPPGSGVLTMSNNVQVLNASHDPTALQIYVYGWSNGANVVKLNSNSPAYEVIYAPQSTVDLTDNGGVIGGVAAGSIVSLGAQDQYSGSNYSAWDPRAAQLQARSTGLYFRSAWQECPATPSSPTDPASGC